MPAGSLASLFQLAYQASPIILSGGIAATLPGGLLPIMAITQNLVIANGLLTGEGVPASLDDFFAQYLPLPGSSLIANEIGKYPFANQAIAANAVIQQPLRISMLMIAPARQPGDMFTKLPTFTALQTALTNHNAAGGLYIVATPAYIYTNCIMTGMIDVTEGESRQRQVSWQLDFEQPLVTTQQAQQSLNALMSKIANGTQIQGNPTWSGQGAAVGTPAQGANSVPGTTGMPAAVQQFELTETNAP
jgi:hypothetical protein